MLQVLELCAGIGAPRLGFNSANIPAVFEAVEFDPEATKSYNAIHGDNIIPTSVVRYIPKMNPDVIFHGSPCQDFSQAGHGKGGVKGSGTRSSILWDNIDIISNTLPDIVIWENVKRATTFQEFTDYIEEMNKLGYETTHQVLNSLEFGIPQHRQRVFVVSARTDKYKKNLIGLFDRMKRTEYKPLGEFIDYIPEKPIVKKLSDCKRLKSYWTYPSRSGRLNSGLCRASDPAMYSPTISTFQTREKIGVFDFDKDTLSVEPLSNIHKAKLMGFSTKHVEQMLLVNKPRFISKQLGNSIVVPILTELFKELFNV